MLDGVLPSYLNTLQQDAVLLVVTTGLSLKQLSKMLGRMLTHVTMHETVLNTVIKHGDNHNIKYHL